MDPNAKEDMIITPPPVDYGGAYVLVPRKKDWSEVQEYIQDALFNRLEKQASESAR